MKMINYEEEHRKLWNWLADHPDKDKDDYFEDWPEERIPIQECFACEATRKGSLAADCGRCPLGGPDIVGCYDWNGLYQTWSRYWQHPKERAELARQIAELPWEDDNND